MTHVHRLSGKQITVCVVAVCITLVMMPVAVFASTGSLVNITDGANAARKATVTGFGGVATSQRDPLTGTWQRVEGTGAARVTGTVNALTALPAHPFAKEVYVPTQATGMKVLGPFTAAQKVAITSFSLSNTGNDPIQYGELQALTADAACTPTNGSYPGDQEAITALAGHATSTTAYPTPMALPTGNPGSTWCLFAIGNWSAGGNVNLYFNVVGFTT